MPKARYRFALEVGCSIGILTRSLASRCDALVAIDAAQTPLVEARRRCADLPDVRFEQMFVPEQWPDGDFELILLSEVVYYLSREDVGRLAARVANSLAKGGSVILVHWTGPTDYPLSGDEAAVSSSNEFIRPASLSAGIDIANFVWTCCRAPEPPSRRWATNDAR